MAFAPIQNVTQITTSTETPVSKTPSTLVGPPQNNATSPTPTTHVQKENTNSLVLKDIIKTDKTNA